MVAPGVKLNIPAKMIERSMGMDRVNLIAETGGQQTLLPG